MTRSLTDLGGPTEGELLQWVKQSIESKSNIFSQGYQAHVYLYESKDRRLIVKAPTGWGLARILHRAMLRNERKVYSRLHGVNGIPSCYGLLDGRYLVLEYVEGVPIRNAKISDQDLFFDKLLNLIKELHACGVVHGDLKKEDNILVVGGDTPCVIDFGVAVVRKPGFAPVNRYLYNTAKRFDFNAWVRLRTGLKTRYLIDENYEYYNRTRVEIMARRIKRTYVKLRRTLFGQRRKYREF